MPWIDPVKEAEAWRMLEAAGYASGPEIIRRRGLNPRDVLEQEANWKKLLAERGITPVLTTQAAPQPAPAPDPSLAAAVRFMDSADRAITAFASSKPSPTVIHNHVAAPDVTVNTPEQKIENHITVPERAVTVNAGDMLVQNDVHVPKPGAVRQTVTYDDKDRVTETVSEPLEIKHG